MDKNNPWIAIWTKPRETITSIVATNPNRSIWALAAVFGFSSLLNLFQSGSLAANIAPLAIFIIAAILSPFWGYFIFSLWSYILLISGKIFRGRGNYKTVRAAYAWSNVPLVLNIPIWILMGLMFGKELFSNSLDGHPMTSGAISVLFVLLIGKIVLSIWSLVIFVNTLSAVQQYSILRSIGNIVVGAIIFVALTIALLMVIAFFTGAPAGVQ